MADLYEDLGISRVASSSEVKSAYRALARKHHPDVRRGDAEADRRFREIHYAYEILSDPERRREYDAWRERDRAQERFAFERERERERQERERQEREPRPSYAKSPQHVYGVGGLGALAVVGVVLAIYCVPHLWRDPPPSRLSGATFSKQGITCDEGWEVIGKIAYNTGTCVVTQDDGTKQDCTIESRVNLETGDAHFEGCEDHLGN